jgi:hypothetical protein
VLEYTATRIILLLGYWRNTCSCWDDRSETLSMHHQRQSMQCPLVLITLSDYTKPPVRFHTHRECPLKYSLR